MKPIADKQWYRIVLILLFAVIGFGAYALMTHKDLAFIGVVMTALVMRLGTMLDFEYGSSRGSKDKTDMLDARTLNVPITPAPVPAPVAAPAPVQIATQPAADAADDKKEENKV